MASRANIYELLDDEGSGPAPAKKAVAAAPAAKSAAAAPAKKAAAAAATTQAPAAAAAPAQGQRQAGEKKFGADKAPRARGNPAEARDRERVERKRSDKEVGHGAGTAGEGRTKRVFDRQSGTGRSRTEQKKGGAGKGNWGKEEDLAKAVEGEASASAAVANVEASVVAAVTKDGEAAAAPAENAAAATEEKKVEEPVGLTLKEWKAKQAKKAVEAANVRKANEGADKKDAKKWEEFKAIDKNNAADLTSDSILAALPIQTENKAAADTAKPAAKSSDSASTGTKKTVRVAANDLLQLKAPAHNFDDSEESDRRGGRGRGPRPGNDRRGPRNERPQGPAAGGQSPRGKHVSSPVFDESSFPSLSVKA